VGGAAGGILFAWMTHRRRLEHHRQPANQPV
jgi:hypothetical protein